MRTREEGTPNAGSVALEGICKAEEAKGYGAQSRLAKELDADEGQFSRWRRGVRTPALPMRLKLEAKFGIPPMAWDEELPKTPSQPPPAEAEEPSDAAPPPASTRTGAAEPPTGTEHG